MGEWKKRGCVLCPQNCGLEVLAGDGRMVKGRPDQDDRNQVTVKDTKNQRRTRYMISLRISVVPRYAPGGSLPGAYPITSSAPSPGYLHTIHR